MSWLNLRKKKTESETPKHLTVKAVSTSVTGSPARTASNGVVRADILRRPHISERASDHAAKGVYAFRVSPDATKSQIGAAVAALYKVTVEKVRTVTIHPKRVTVKGRRGIRGGGKKAYVYLKPGQRIDNL